jgi:hypothetical protein
MPSPPSWPRRRTPIPPVSRPGWQPTPCSASAGRWSPTSASRCWLANTTGRASPANSAPRPDRRPRCSSGARSARRLRNPRGRSCLSAARAMSGGRACGHGPLCCGRTPRPAGHRTGVRFHRSWGGLPGHQRVCRLAGEAGPCQLGPPDGTAGRTSRWPRPGGFRPRSPLRGRTGQGSADSAGELPVVLPGVPPSAGGLWSNGRIPGWSSLPLVRQVVAGCGCCPAR